MVSDPVLDHLYGDWDFEVKIIEQRIAELKRSIDAINEYYIAEISIRKSILEEIKSE